MARANTVTWLSLDRYAEIMGINPLHFNGVYSTLKPDTNCSDLWMQYSWQDNDQVAREDIARAIHDAERQIAQYIGYPLLPDWIIAERHQVVRPYRPELFNVGGTNMRGLFKSTQTRWGHVITGGQRAKTLVVAATAITRSDADGDGYSELCTITVTTTVEACELRVYHPGKSGADEWEIRPVTVTDNGATVTITFKVWQAVKPAKWEALNASGVDGDTAANFETTVDVYRVYNDPQSQAQFLWEQPACSSCGGSGCTACLLASQDGCQSIRDARLGLFAYRPAEWDADTSAFEDEEWVECREPDQLRIWYKAGWRDETRACPDTQMDQALERAVAYYATALLDRPLCSCTNVQAYAEKWREDLAMSNSTRSFQNAMRVLDCPLGTTRGAVYAWGIANEEWRKVPR